MNRSDRLGESSNGVHNEPVHHQHVQASEEVERKAKAICLPAKGQALTYIGQHRSRRVEGESNKLPLLPTLACTDAVFAVREQVEEKKGPS